MVNPFTHTAKNVAQLYSAAHSSDCAPGPAVFGATLIMPIVIPTLFISAFFTKSK